MQISVRALGLTLFEIRIDESVDDTPAFVMSDVTSIPVYLPTEEATEGEDDDGRIETGFQQRKK